MELLSKKVKNITVITDENLQKSYFNFDGDILDIDENTLMLYGVEENSQLEHVESFNEGGRDPGALGGIGAKFVNVSHNNGLKRREWDKEAPEWRRVNRGLVLEGECTNSKCKAYGNTVAISMNYRKFDVVCDPDIDKTVCPVCKQYVEPKTCGFNNCWWRFEGVKKEGSGKPPQSCQSNWRQADDAYHYFDQEISGTITWLRLTFEVVKNKPAK
ncbi:unnamed protein product [Rotaria sordida]|uniref:Uncharacterized protein n=1 Tax=Rotaria sordida TaxID=392033 RepID=A0A814LYF3_9BILA|nr:unnamed protein product [Rotaria sordida]CAF1195168.1 unnamed protein product [Rotaria sordida]